MTYETIIVAAALTALVILVVWLRHKRPQPDLFTRAMKTTNRRRKASGLQVWVEDGAQVPDAAVIETGLLDCFHKGLCRGYTRALTLGEYIVVVLKAAPERSSDGMPALAIPAGTYAGTVFDKGGYILIAGQMLTAGEPYGNIIVIPEHALTDAENNHLRLIIEYEAEHVILAYNDEAEFERTKFHGGGVSHPIIPDCDGARKLEPRMLCGPPSR